MLIAGLAAAALLVAACCQPSNRVRPLHRRDLHRVRRWSERVGRQDRYPFE